MVRMVIKKEDKRCGGERGIQLDMRLVAYRCVRSGPSCKDKKHGNPIRERGVPMWAFTH
jgi:hypothetical protein